VLFPIVGGLKNGLYQYKGNTYQLGRHGFARERDFSVAAQSANSITFTLESDTETLAVYPFAFRFSVVYTLEETTLHVGYLVENTGEESMYFSIGAHPAFAVPLISGTIYADYYLAFEQKETAGKWPLSGDGLIEANAVSMLENTDKLPLSKELFYGDALVFKHLKSNNISILTDKSKHGLTVHFEGFPYMGIWSAKNADFVCIEPWCGIADSVNASGNLTEKEGINLLLPNDQFMRNWNVKVF
jgi:galactose mutarotase-like enzyme